MSFYPVSSRPAIPGGEQAAARAVMVAVPVSALVVAGAEPVTAGEPVVWCKVMVTASAVLRRDGRVQA